MAPRKTSSTVYSSVRDIIRINTGLFRPPERLSISDAAEEYVRLNHPVYTGPYQNDRAPYMVEPMNCLQSRLLSGVVFCGPAQSGKALHVNTPIATPFGWTVMGRLKVGDKIFGSKGQQVTVTKAHPVRMNRTCYEVVFDDGSSIIADAEHLWTVDDLLLEHTATVNTEFMAERYVFGKKSRSRFAIPVAKPIVTDQLDLPIDPYVLGAWLGDGHLQSPRLTLHRNEMDIVKNIEAAGHVVDCSYVPGTQSMTVLVDRPNSRKDKNLGSSLRKAGLIRDRANPNGKKHIPELYLRASIPQRIALLNGLMDTDGTCGKDTKAGACGFCTTLPDLAEGFSELLSSLGIKFQKRKRVPICTKSDGSKVEGALAYYFTFMSYGELPVFKLERKQNRIFPRSETRKSYVKRRFITAIRETVSVPVRCIAVDSPDRLFLAGENMIPTHNTEALILNWLAYSIRVDPMDMLIYNPTGANARDFSKRRIDRMHRHSPEIGAQLVQRRDADNTFDKHYISGMMATLSWPTVSEMSGKPVPRIALTDYDRMPEDVEGDGSPFDLAQKRTTTFESFAMTCAESSPSREVTNPKYIPQTPHEAPPTTGILALYNRGDRRRWYWACPHCEEYFEGLWEHIKWDVLDSNLRSSKTARMVCPCCNQDIQHSQKRKMNLSGVWLKEGQYVDSCGFVCGTGLESETASFWLRGVAAAFVSWQKLVNSYLDALDAFNKTGDEEALKKFYNTDLGEPYIPKGQGDERSPLDLMNRRIPLAPKRVPLNTRFLIATVDVQKRSYMAHVYAVQPGHPADLVVIDRIPIWLSDRIGDSGEPMGVRPGIYLDDWSLIESKILDQTYELDDDSGRRMPVKMAFCDSGGQAGVTAMAYAYWRTLREERKAHRLLLVKGTPTPGAPNIALHFPDAQRKDQFAVARGDVPVLMINSNKLKDMADNRLSCIEPGKGMVSFAEHLPDEIYSELCAETRTPKGWENPSNARNEAWDCLCYVIAGCMSSAINIDRIDWSNPPLWADDWDKNPTILKPDQQEQFAYRPKVDYDFAALGRQLG